MSPLRQALVDYLAVRRSLGFKLGRAEGLLLQFVNYAEERGEQHLLTSTMLAWATLPVNTHKNWLAKRLSIVRGFASHLHTIDPAAEVPPTDLLPWQRCRATPYLYSDGEVAALITAASSLRKGYRVLTFQTLIGLLAATGMRVGEALALDRKDIDVAQRVLTIRLSKFGKSRELPVHRSTIEALGRYLRHGDRPHVAASVPAVFVSNTGTRLSYPNVQWTFQVLVHRAGLARRSAACRPRVHDLRHRFAVQTMLDAYRRGEDAEARLTILSTYLGHVNPKATYWYLSAAPELMQLAADRLESHLGGVS
jgi:integrase